MTSPLKVDDTVRTGEKIPYYLEVEGTTILTASWQVDSPGEIVSNAETDTQSTALVSFPATGRYKVIGTLDLANGGRVIGALTVVVNNP